jgi:hypothetical protein
MKEEYTDDLRRDFTSVGILTEDVTDQELLDYDQRLKEAYINGNFWQELRVLQGKRLN